MTVNKAMIKIHGYNKSINDKFEKEWKVQYGYNHSKTIVKSKSRGIKQHKENLNEILSTLSKTHKTKVKQIRSEKAKIEDKNLQALIKQCVSDI